MCEAGDGEEALVQIAERKPDIVLLDWMLPLVSGIEVCRRIRRSPQTRALPVIMLTARGEESDRVRGLDSGADDYVVKPFSPSELVARLRAVIRRAAPSAAEEVLQIRRGFARPRRPPRVAGRQAGASRPDRVSPAALSDAASRAGFLARAVARRGLGP